MFKEKKVWLPLFLRTNDLIDYWHSAYNGLYLIDNRYQFTSTAFISTSADYFYRNESFLSIFTAIVALQFLRVKLWFEISFSAMDDTNYQKFLLDVHEKFAFEDLERSGEIPFDDANRYVRTINFNRHQNR